MQDRKLGNTGFKVAPLALGGNVFGWTADEPTSFKLLDAFVDKGFNLVDTADIYSHWAPGRKGGESETIIGNWLKKSGKRSHVVIATKVGLPMGEKNKAFPHPTFSEQWRTLCAVFRPTTLISTKLTKTIPTHHWQKRWGPSRS
jgi:aryl-alcohol dehydrogenase-like predicted oxidoreductase